MDILSSLLLGIIQGAAEFLPISSSAHLALCHSLFGMVPPDGYPAFDVMLHAGTLFAVIFAYRKDMPAIIKGYFTFPYKLVKHGFRLESLDAGERAAVFTALATVPAVIAALLGAARLSDTLCLYPSAVGALLILNGVMLLVADGCGEGKYTVTTVGYRHALAAGLFQALSTVPGISRSGATVTASRLCGVKRYDAVKLSFLTSIPAITGAVALRTPDVIRSSPGLSDISVYLVGCGAALVTGLLCIKLLTFISDKTRFKYFSFYCFALGAYAVCRGQCG